jgi:hypothetical protein
MDFEPEYQQCLDKLSWAIDRLGEQVDPSQLGEIADLIVQPMTGPWRYFHTPQHIFDVGGSTDAIEVLAALFHDLVYVQVDRSVNFNLSYHIAPFAKEIKGQLQIRPTTQVAHDSMFEMVTSVFGFSPGQALSPTAGQNEFLSALVAAKVLEPFLSPALILKTIACIEATIPFQSVSADGLTASDRLYARLQVTSDRFKLGLSDTELLDSVRRAVRVANRDVLGFAYTNSASFLENTWNLLPETNHNLMHINSYTVHDYRVALQKMEGFMNFLKAEVIFRQFAGEPDDLTYAKLIANARTNLEIARLYLGSKLFAIACLEALSLRVGLDIPLSTMMGELPSSEGSEKIVQLEDFLPNFSDPFVPANEVEQEVLNLLEKGRSNNAAYDIKHSPISTFMVKVVGFDEIRRQRSRAQEFFQEKLSPEDFISGCDPQITKIIIDGVVQLFESRKAALCKGERE